MWWAIELNLTAAEKEGEEYKFLVRGHASPAVGARRCRGADATAWQQHIAQINKGDCAFISKWKGMQTELQMNGIDFSTIKIFRQF